MAHLRYNPDMRRWLIIFLLSVCPSIWAQSRCGELFLVGHGEGFSVEETPMLVQVLSEEAALHGNKSGETGEKLGATLGASADNSAEGVSGFLHGGSEFFRFLDVTPGESSVAEPPQSARRDWRQWSGTVKGASTVVGLMAATALTTTYLSQNLTGPTQFLSHFVLIASSMGIYRFGAILLEPISSRVQQKGAHLLHRHDQHLVPSPETHSHLTDLWNHTQTHYSANAQMSRNVLNSLLSKSHHQLRAVYTSLQVGDLQYAAQQLALVAVDMRALFQEVRPDNPYVARNVRGTILTPELSPFALQLRERVLGEIRDMDPDFQTDSRVRDYYLALLNTWLASQWRGLAPTEAN